jgi:hypothetical protein
LRRNDHGQLLGAWTTAHADGSLGFLHLWSYTSLDARTRLRQALVAKPAWLSDFIQPVMPLLRQQTLSILNPVLPHRSLAQPASGHLQRICCLAGQAASVVAALQRETPFVWTTEFPDPNEVACISPTPALRLLEGSADAVHALVQTVRTSPLQAFAHPPLH